VAAVGQLIKIADSGLIWLFSWSFNIKTLHLALYLAMHLAVH